MSQVTTKKRITEAERIARAGHINTARVSVRMEGFILGEDVEAISAKYINGEISLKNILKRY